MSQLSRLITLCQKYGDEPQTFNAKHIERAEAELVRLEAIEAAAWKLAEHPDSEAAKADLLRLLGVEL